MRPCVNSAYKAYSTTKSNTDKENLLIMLYECALRFVRLAQFSIANKKFNEKGENISKVIAIITELDCALDHKIGGEIAANLSALYCYMIDKMTDANINNNPGALDEVVHIMTPLKDGFKKIKEEKYITTKSPKEIYEKVSFSV